MEVLVMEDNKTKSEAHLTFAAFVEGGIQYACGICLEAFCDSDLSTPALSYVYTLLAQYQTFGMGIQKYMVAIRFGFCILSVLLFVTAISFIGKKEEQDDFVNELLDSASGLLDEHTQMVSGILTMACDICLEAFYDSDLSMVTTVQTTLGCSGANIADDACGDRIGSHDGRCKFAEWRRSVRKVGE